MPVPAAVTKEIVDLALRGMPPRDIFRHLDARVTLDRIYVVLSKARSQGIEIPRYGSGRATDGALRDIRIVVSGASRVARFAAAARRRNLSMTELMQKLADTIADDDLFNAVLEEG